MTDREARGETNAEAKEQRRRGANRDPQRGQERPHPLLADLEHVILPIIGMLSANGTRERAACESDDAHGEEAAAAVELGGQERGDYGERGEGERVIARVCQGEYGPGEQRANGQRAWASGRGHVAPQPGMSTRRPASVGAVVARAARAPSAVSR